jgi:hypothetical protein
VIGADFSFILVLGCSKKIVLFMISSDPFSCFNLLLISLVTLLYECGPHSIWFLCVKRSRNVKQCRWLVRFEVNLRAGFNKEFTLAAGASTRGTCPFNLE